MTQEKLVKIVTFRLSESEFEPYKKILDETDIKKSRLFREVFIAKSGAIELPKEQSKSTKRLLFLASKASNNINQIARKLNNAYRTGIINEKVYLETLNNLISLERSFAGAIDKC